MNVNNQTLQGITYGVAPTRPVTNFSKSPMPVPPRLTPIDIHCVASVMFSSKQMRSGHPEMESCPAYRVMMQSGEESANERGAVVGTSMCVCVWGGGGGGKGSAVVRVCGCNRGKERASERGAVVRTSVGVGEGDTVVRTRESVCGCGQGKAKSRELVPS
jgi:hypothetical protein